MAEGPGVARNGVLMKGREAKVMKVCEVCGREIPKARLEAVPGVTTCVECARKSPKGVDVRKYDLSESSPINRNGFAPKD